MHVLRFTIDETRYAIDIGRVVEVAPRVLVTPLPGAADFVEGLFSHRGRVCVAIALRRRLAHPARPPSIADHIVVIDGKKRLLGLVVDRVSGDAHLREQEIQAQADASRHIKGVVTLADGVLLVEDIDALMTDDEESALESALAGEPS